MELSRKSSEVSISFLPVCVEVTILLTGFNLQGLNIATATSVVRGNDTDQQALLQFKAKITGDPLKIMESWNSSIHFCQWRGITCGRKHPRITKLELPSLKLSGSLSPYIGNLSFLMELNLSGNGFYNEIPQEIGHLRRLKTLEMTNNSVSGEIPSNLSACSKLIWLHMADNQLTGEIPASLGLLSNLKVLGVYDTRLTGSIPPSLGNLSSLETISFASNSLSGIIPEALGRLTNLSFFAVGENEISGIVPVSMFNLSNLMAFDIGGNKIQGTLHSDIEFTMPNVEIFSIRGNQISGQIPISISNASNLNVLQVYDNRLSGSVPSLEKLDKLKIPPQVLGIPSLTILLILSLNHLTGELPVEVEKLKNLGELDLSHNKLSGMLPKSLGSCASLEKLFLEGNLFERSIPSSLSSLRGLEALDISDNNLSGEIPIYLVNFGALKFLNLSFNDFEGVLPSEGVFKNLSYQSLLRATDGFATHNLVGSGNFGYVYKGILEESGVSIAVKVLTAVSGVDYKGNDFKALVYEFMQNGSLEDWLHQSITMNEPETSTKHEFLSKI
ncbi:LRR receptor-like serine/threonine-protein kinase EFR [Hibiscus syriacus]|uniref:LRR receptor-like serine/threonine-protein kinase EFR n=1 Tax=Hibiscus syriacus TaxID=106335 RepID=UPI0019250E6B|nr:LRR receptor-like serine/threonine-protein kinase EFR [Hibiscus syriacus]